MTAIGGSSENAFTNSKPTAFLGSGALTTTSLTPVALSREDTPLSEATATDGANGESAAEEPQPEVNEVYEGEEDETTIHSVKTKVSKLVMKDGKGEWSTMGVGLFKLKQHNETGVRRILHRDTASRRIVIVSDRQIQQICVEYSRYVEFSIIQRAQRYSGRC